MNKLLKSALSLAMVLAFMLSLGAAAFAQEYDLANGAITVDANVGGQTVSQVGGVTNEAQTSETVITSPDSGTSNTVTINVADNATANVTMSDVYIEAEDEGDAAVSITGNGNVNIELDGANILVSAEGHAGIEKSEGSSLTINDKNDEFGSLIAYGGSGGAGIGGGESEDGTNITITGGLVSASGAGGAGIGGGKSGDGKNITITGGEVHATGNFTSRGGDGTLSVEVGAGIGGGSGGSANNISISGGEVKAESANGGAGIGGGAYSKINSSTGQVIDSASGGCTNISISGSANVTATAGDSWVSGHGEQVIAAGTAIGRGANGLTSGAAVTPDTSKLTSEGKLVLKNGALTDTVVGTYEGPASAAASAVASAVASSSILARYYVAKGNDQVWLIDSVDGLEFTLNVSGNGLVKVFIDGEEVDFEVGENGVIVIAAEVLQALEAGEHVIKFVFADGSCKTDFTVK